jgi:hypothetical protein
MIAPNWTAQPPPEAWRDTIAAAEYAAHDDPARCCVTIVGSRCNPGWLVIAGVYLLAGAIAEDATADELRAEVLRIAAATCASDYMVTASLEVVALADAVQRGEIGTVHELCLGSQVSALDLAHLACSVTGQTIEALAVDVGAVFDRLRHQYGIGEAS